MDYIEKTIKKNYIYEGKILKLRRDEAALPNGEPCFREIVEHSGGASVLYIEDGKVLLVRQFRYAYGWRRARIRCLRRKGSWQRKRV